MHLLFYQDCSQLLVQLPQCPSQSLGTHCCCPFPILSKHEGISFSSCAAALFIGQGIPSPDDSLIIFISLSQLLPQAVHSHSQSIFSGQCFPGVHSSLPDHAVLNQNQLDNYSRHILDKYLQ